MFQLYLQLTVQPSRNSKTDYDAVSQCKIRTVEASCSSHHLTHWAFHRSGTAAGKVTFTVSCEGCEDETIDIVVE